VKNSSKGTNARKHVNSSIFIRNFYFYVSHIWWKTERDGKNRERAIETLVHKF
jgi:hypothetical protein